MCCSSPSELEVKAFDEIPTDKFVKQTKKKIEKKEW